ncbi:hypothetical protein KAR91_53960 [Candidatus Pacearchaeota archaeon]|nr:hypothetical protein [Candidatus Pacearchaeota archaeon]
MIENRPKSLRCKGCGKPLDDDSVDDLCMICLEGSNYEREPADEDELLREISDEDFEDTFKDW